MRRTFPARPTRALGTGRAILESRGGPHPQREVDPEFTHQALGRAVGYRSCLWVPMMRVGAPIGVIAVARAEPGPFSDNQIELLKTFADQAVIAIENVRLFNETKEALEQQTAMASVLRAISGSPMDTQPVFEMIAESAARLCEAHDAVVRRVHDGYLEVAAIHGSIPTMRLPIDRAFPSGRAFLDRETVHILDLEAHFASLPSIALEIRAAVDLGVRTVAAVPLMREGAAMGTSRSRPVVRPFTDKQIALVKTFANQAVIAIENVRLFTELEMRNRELTESLEQQTATGEILQVISTSPTDMQPVFDTMVRSATLLCGAGYGTAVRFDGELMHLVASYNHMPEVADALHQIFPTWPSPLTMSGRAILAGDVGQVEDALDDADYAEGVARAGGFRSMFAAPMVRDGHPIGAIVVNRGQPGPFSRTQIELLKTFASQAVIAIETCGCSRSEARNREADRDPGATDGDGRDPAGDLDFTGGSSARLRRDRRERNPVTPRARPLETARRRRAAPRGVQHDRRGGR